MTPCIIHYCWFGRNPLPPLALKCIESWKKYCPDYEIKEWNEDNFDIHCCRYVEEAYMMKKWAFVADYARFYVLYQYGGIYFDTDVEVLKPLDPILKKGAFMGCEIDGGQRDICVNPGLGAAVNPGLGILKEILDFYGSLRFIKADGRLNLTTVVQYTTEMLFGHGLQNISGIQNVEGIWIYPTEYFCPKDYATGKTVITDNTYTIHHFDGSWLSKKGRLLYKLRRFIGEKNWKMLIEIKKKITC